MKKTIFWLITTFSLLRLTSSCTKEAAQQCQSCGPCDTCHVTPILSSIGITVGNWIEINSGEYISHLNGLLQEAGIQPGQIYALSVETDNGVQQIFPNAFIHYLNGGMSFREDNQKYDLIFSPQRSEHYGETSYAPMPFTLLDIQVLVLK